MRIRAISLAVYSAEFLLASFIGWLYETALTSAVWGRFAERGALGLPLCPIYGFGALLLTACLSRVKSGAAIFLIGAAVTTVMELILSYPLEAIFGYRLWNYSHWPLNFQGRISLLSSLVFGLFSLFWIKVVHKRAKRIRDRLCNKK